MDHYNQDNINGRSNSRILKSDEQMDFFTPQPSSRKRKISYSIDTSPAKRTFTGSDVCDQSASSSYVSFTNNYIPVNFASHAPVRMNNKILDDVYKSYNDVIKHVSDKHSLFPVNSIVNFINGANITSGKRILIYDELGGGMVTVFALKLLKGDGEVWFLFERFSSQSYPAFKAMDTSKNFRLIRLSSITNILSSALISDPSKMNALIDEESMDCEDSTKIRPPRRLEFIPEKLDVLPRFDTILVLSDMISPVSFLESFYDFLLPSATIAVFTHSEEEAQMVQAFLVASNAKDINIASMTTIRNHYDEAAQEMGYFINAIKSA